MCRLYKELSLLWAVSYIVSEIELDCHTYWYSIEFCLIVVRIPSYILQACFLTSESDYLTDISSRYTQYIHGILQEPMHNHNLRQ